MLNSILGITYWEGAGGEMTDRRREIDHVGLAVLCLHTIILRHLCFSSSGISLYNIRDCPVYNGFPFTMIFPLQWISLYEGEGGERRQEGERGKWEMVEWRGGEGAEVGVGSPGRGRGGSPGERGERGERAAPEGEGAPSLLFS